MTQNVTNSSEYLKVISPCEVPVANVIFVHGLNGDQQETWQCGADNKILWPTWFHEEFSSLAIYSLGYPANKFAQSQQDLFERANSALDYIASLGLAKCPLVFVGHSLGGLLIKSILRKSQLSSDDGLREISDTTRMVVFIATPHNGASLASIGKNVLPHLISSHVNLLANDTGTLQDLNEGYRDYCDQKPDVRTVVYYEKLKTFKVLVVDRCPSSDNLRQLAL